MQAVRAYYDGNAFIPIMPVNARRNQTAIVTILDDEPKRADNKAVEQFFGALSNESFAEIEEALKDTEQVDVSEW